MYDLFLASSVEFVSVHVYSVIEVTLEKHYFCVRLKSHNQVSSTGSRIVVASVV